MVQRFLILVYIFNYKTFFPIYDVYVGTWINLSCDVEKFSAGVVVFSYGFSLVCIQSKTVINNNKYTNFQQN